MRSLCEGGLSVCVQPGVRERGRGLGSERTQVAILQGRCEQLLQRRRQLEVRHHQVLRLVLLLLICEFKDGSLLSGPVVLQYRNYGSSPLRVLLFVLTLMRYGVNSARISMRRRQISVFACSLTFIYPSKRCDNKFSFKNTTWPKGSKNCTNQYTVNC